MEVQAYPERCKGKLRDIFPRSCARDIFGRIISALTEKSSNRAAGLVALRWRRSLEEGNGWLVPARAPSQVLTYVHSVKVSVVTKFLIG